MTMSFAWIGLFALITSMALWTLRAVLARELRWKFYALRDELRDAAYQDRSLLGERPFWDLDRSLTLYCRHLEELSLWSLLPVALARKHTAAAARSHQQLELLLDLPENAPLKRVYHRSQRLVLSQFLLRHWIALPLFILGGLAWAAARQPIGSRMQRALGSLILNPPVGQDFNTPTPSPTPAA